MFLTCRVVSRRDRLCGKSENQFLSPPAMLISSNWKPYLNPRNCCRPPCLAKSAPRVCLLRYVPTYRTTRRLLDRESDARLAEQIAGLDDDGLEGGGVDRRGDAHLHLHDCGAGGR